MEKGSAGARHAESAVSSACTRGMTESRMRACVRVWTRAGGSRGMDAQICENVREQHGHSHSGGFWFSFTAFKLPKKKSSPIISVPLTPCLWQPPVCPLCIYELGFYVHMCICTYRFHISERLDGMSLSDRLTSLQYNAREVWPYCHEW